MFVRVATLVAAAVGAAAIGVASPAYAGSDGSDVHRVITLPLPATAYPTPRRVPRIGRPPRSAKTATTPITNTHTQAARATATAAGHKC